LKKIQFSILAIDFSEFSSTDSIFYSLLAFKYYFVWEKKCERNRDRDRERERERESNKKLFVVE